MPSYKKIIDIMDIDEVVTVKEVAEAIVVVTGTGNVACENIKISGSYRGIQSGSVFLPAEDSKVFGSNRKVRVRRTSPLCFRKRSYG